MNGNLGRDRLWNQQIWSDIDNAVRDEVGRVRVAQKVFPGVLLPNEQQVPADKVGSDSLSIAEGKTKPFVEIWAEFTLAQSQVDSEESLHTGRTLARMAANKLATAEDALLFQGKVGAKTHLQSKGIVLGTQVQERNADQLGCGFLGEAVHPELQKLKDPLKKFVDKVPDHAAVNKFDNDLTKIVEKPDNTLFKTVKGKLSNIAKEVSDHASGKELQNDLKTIADKVLSDDELEYSKDNLSALADDVSSHVAGSELQRDLADILATDDSAKLGTVKAKLRDLAEKVSTTLTASQNLKAFADRVYNDVGVKDPEGDPKSLITGVLGGIAKLSDSAQTGPYALFLPLNTFAAASAPLQGTLVTAADRITPLVTGGFWGAGCLPRNEGLLVSLGGEPTTIYIGIDATTAFTQVEANGIYRFRVFERIQFVARDSRAFLIFTIT